MATVSTITAADVNITAYKGDTFRVTLTFTDANSDPIDLSTAAFKMQLVRSTCGGDPVLTLESGDGITVGGDDDNVVTVETLLQLDKGIYRYDLQATFADSSVSTYLKGSFTVKDDITE